MAVQMTAYKVGVDSGWVIEPAPGRRAWMDATPDKFAYRCLPLVMANQAGWVVRSPLSFVATWDGSVRPEGLKIRFTEDAGACANQVSSHFGSGIVTFSLPWLFRTSKGVGLWVRGPANEPRDNLVALDGIVETDWAPYTFTMNWRVMRRGEAFFKAGDAVCMLVPMMMELAEDVVPQIREIDDNPVLKEDFTHFVAKRSGNIQKLKEGGGGTWAMDYMRGHLPDGTEVREHRKAFRLRGFEAGE